MNKNKDPAFLFYSSDFLTGTCDLTMEERGQYITLICLQHQKGHLTDKTIRLCLGLGSDMLSVDILSKFEKDEDGLLFNRRIEEEIDKRKNFNMSRRKNGKKGGRPKTDRLLIGLPTENLSENENENENKDVNINKNESKNEVIKHKYGLYKNVLLSDKDYEKLTAEFPSDYMDRIERLSEYIESKGVKYKSHLATIRSWSKKDKPKSQKVSFLDIDF